MKNCILRFGTYQSWKSQNFSDTAQNLNFSGQWPLQSFNCSRRVWIKLTSHQRIYFVFRSAWTLEAFSTLTFPAMDVRCSNVKIFKKRKAHISLLFFFPDMHAIFIRYLSLMWICSTWLRWQQTVISKINCRPRAVVDVCQYLITRSVWCRHVGTSSNEPCQHLNVIHFLSRAETQVRCTVETEKLRPTGVADSEAVWTSGVICSLNVGVRHEIERC